MLLFFLFLAISALLSSSHALNSSLADPESVVLDLQRKVGVSLRRALTSSPCLTGNPIDDCWRCDSNWAQNPQRLADCGVGFGRNAVGGKGGKIYVVTKNSDSDPANPVPGTLRHAVIQPEPLWITFSSSTIIRLSQELIVSSFKTIDGRGVDVHITGKGCITLQDVSNVIIHNVNVHHCIPGGNTNVRSSPTHVGFRGRSDGDGISISGSSDLWIDHCSLSYCSDGLIDAILGSTRITISNNYFAHHDEVMLLGHNDAYLPDKNMQVTIAFNHFGKALVQRMPRVRHGYVHVVNNDFTRWEMYAIGGSADPTVVSQGNRYTAPSDPNAKEVTKRVDTAEPVWGSWNWRSEGDVMVNGAFFVPSGEATMAEAESGLEAQSPGIIDQLTMNAGVIGGGGGGGGRGRGRGRGSGSGDNRDGDGGATDPGGVSYGGINGGGGGDSGYYEMIFAGGGMVTKPSKTFLLSSIFVGLVPLIVVDLYDRRH